MFRMQRLSVLCLLGVSFCLNQTAQAGLLLVKPWEIFIESNVEKNFGPGEAWTGGLEIKPGYTIAGSEREYQILVDGQFKYTDDDFTVLDPYLGFSILPVFKIGGWKFNLWNRLYFPGSKNSRANSLRFAYYFRFYSHNVVLPKFLVGGRLVFKTSNYKYSLKQGITGDITKMEMDQVLESSKDASLNDLVEGMAKAYFDYNIYSKFHIYLDFALRLASTYSDGATGRKSSFYGNPVFSQEVNYEFTPDATLGVNLRQEGKIFDNGATNMFRKANMTLQVYLDLTI